MVFQTKAEKNNAPKPQTPFLDHSNCDMNLLKCASYAMRLNNRYHLDNDCCEPSFEVPHPLECNPSLEKPNRTPLKKKDATPE